MVRHRIGLFYPGPRSVAYSSIVFHLINGYYREVHGLTVYNYYLENDSLIAEPHGAPDPRKLDLILVSLPYELMYLDFARMLVLAGLNPRREARRGPIIVGGGPAVTGNPLPMLGILDAALIGEAEPILDGLIEALSRGSRDKRLASMADLKGLLVPGSSSLPVRRVYVADLDRAWYPVKMYYFAGTVEPVWGKSYPIESSRGCGRGCRFCMEGFIFRPLRHRSFEVMQDLIARGVRSNRVDKVSFYSLAFFDNPDAEDALRYVVEELRLEASVPSIRLETLTPERLRLIAMGKQRTLSIAPETGSCRIGRALGKWAEPDLVVKVAREAIEAGIKSIKLYFIVGSPGEGKEDIEGTISLAELIAKSVAGLGGRVKATVNPFIPKPSTPMQWAGMPETKLLKGLISDTIKRLRKVGVDARSYDIRLAEMQALLGLGDEKVGNAIVEWALKGARGIGAFKRILASMGVDIRDYIKPKPLSWEPPWHRVIEHPYAKLEWLKLEYEAMSRMLTRGC
ncbi:MAG: radical SAM protein [Desulfurococcales archaeon]|nr:radical SAM protein [Desulfurococcales archaeon]